MDPIVLRVEHFATPGGPMATLRVELPFDVANKCPPSPLMESPTSAACLAGVYGIGTANGVQAMGERILASLSSNIGVKLILDSKIAATNDPAPIYVRVNTSATLPWESMYHPTRRFLALDPQRRWPIARIAGSHPRRDAKLIQLPLRIAVVLAAAQREARHEWEYLYGALKDSAISFAASVFVAEDELKTSIEAHADSRVTVTWVPPTKEELNTALCKLGPHRMHVFAHRSAGAEAYLQIATRAGFDGDPSYQLYLGAGDLGMLSDTLWLVVLNACRGADASAQVESLAYALVCNEDIPAVIGMRDLIDSADANRFTKAFYGAAAERLAQVTSHGNAISFPWHEMLHYPRVALRDKHAGPEVASAHGEWTLPILYVRDVEMPVRFAVPAVPVAPEERVRLATERKVLLAALDAGMLAAAPPEVSAALQARIQELETMLGVIRQTALPLDRAG
jgi:hypothetical protein